MIAIVLVVVLLVGSSVSMPFGDEKILSKEILIEVNTLNVGWEATWYPQFENLTRSQAKKMLGSRGAWPKGQEPEVLKVKIAPEALPTEFDSRQKWPGSIHPIRNQGQCGSCWAFGASEVLADRFAIVSQNKVMVTLSAQQLVDCDSDNQGCKGGWPINAFNYMIKTGLLTEQCYGPYYAKQYACRVTPSTYYCPSETSVRAVFYHAKNAYRLPAKNVEAIQGEIMTNGPVEADFTVYQDFFQYKSGVYVHTTGAKEGGHAIKIIGWGTENGVPYWLCANSWGTYWGLQGFFKIRRGTDECAIEDGIVAGQPRFPL